MASISTEKKTGRRIVQFVGTDGKRRSIRLGKLTKKQADTVCTKVEATLAATRANRPLDAEAAEWIGGLSDDMHRKLVKVGLLTKRTCDGSLTLGEHLADYLARRKNVKGSTKLFYSHTVRNLLDYFSADHKLKDITPRNADDFRRYLQSEDLAAATVSRRCSLGRAIFRDAVRHRLISENPFEGIRLGSQSNPSRQQFVTVETIQQVLDACPNQEWRLLVALSRFAGLRVPSEALILRWEDIHPDRMLVRSPKTEHHEGKESRWVPIFPELRPYLEDVHAITPDGALFVLDKLRRMIGQSSTGWSAINLRTQLRRILSRAGVKPWPRLWHALRSSRQTELTQVHPEHLVCKWMGNSRRIADQHYLVMRDEDFAHAAATDCSALQKAVQHASAIIRNDRQTDAEAIQKPLVLPQVAITRETLRKIRLGDIGLEPMTSIL